MGISKGQDSDTRFQGDGASSEAVKPEVPQVVVVAVAVEVQAEHREDGARRVLLITRKTPPCRGQLALPGTWVPGGVGPEEALRRAVKDETNLDVIVERRSCRIVCGRLRGPMEPMAYRTYAGKAVAPRSRAATARSRRERRDRPARGARRCACAASTEPTGGRSAASPATATRARSAAPTRSAGPDVAEVQHQEAQDLRDSEARGVVGHQEERPLRREVLDALERRSVAPVDHRLEPSPHVPDDRGRGATGLHDHDPASPASDTHRPKGTPSARRAVARSSSLRARRSPSA